MSIQTLSWRVPTLTLLSVAVLLGLSGCSDNDSVDSVIPPDNSSDYSADIQRTEFGIPHITADNYKGLGYGVGYAFAEDNICSLARELIVARGESMLYLGDDGNAAILGGFALALATYGLLQLGRRWLSWRLFFRVTEVLLLLLACQMFTSGAEKLIGLGVLPFTDPLWDTSWLVNDMSRWGGLIAGLTGYRAMPGAVTVAVWVVYWGAIYAISSWQSRQTRPATGGAA